MLVSSVDPHTGAPLTEPSSARLGAGLVARWRQRDPLRRHRAVVGTRAGIRWWERGRAIVGLIVMVLAIGVALAAIIAGSAFLASLILETSVE